MSTTDNKVRTNTSVARWTLSIAVISLALSGAFPILLKVSIASFAIFAIWLVGRCIHNIRYWHTRPQPFTKVSAEWPHPPGRKPVFRKDEIDEYSDYIFNFPSSYGLGRRYRLGRREE
ncbi:hypothetical protein [Geobacter grbiciae]|uniref:hypothetical protein n=1 Tax=Geobacter grbiciae TaxID=155042 RepID=UPI001C01977F|nr:hypothetical protein [Geobacter grbiciae]MBT1077184.1 hypothetical protein [Geobacter grbiciae]